MMKRIILKKYESAYVFCGNALNTLHFKGELICSTYVSKAKNESE